MAEKFKNTVTQVINANHFIASADGNVAKQGKMEKWIPGTAGHKTSTVEVTISCRDLADRDVLSKSDPMVVIYTRPPGSKSWYQTKRTEIIRDNLNPDFVTKVCLDYKFESVQPLRFEVYDVDEDTPTLSRQDTLGMIEASLGQIVSAGEHGLTLELLQIRPKDGAVILENAPGSITLTAEELPSEKNEIDFKLGGNGIGSWSGCLPPKTFFAVSKMNEVGKQLVVYRSLPGRGKNPVWPPCKISSRTLCNGDFDRELQIEIYQMKFSGLFSRLGYVTLTLGEMMTMSASEKIQMMTTDGHKLNSYVRVVSCSMAKAVTFLDFLSNGTQIQSCFAVDFTCSNGDPKDPQSLHYLSSNNVPNPYEQAIQAVGNIVKDYDNMNLFAGYGFGARLPPIGDISHLFNLTLAKSPNCSSLPGVLEAYRGCLSKIQLFGPTNFAPVIEEVTKVAASTTPGEVYHILVIVTDGVISDLPKTKKAIVDAATKPLSIIIIGVGEVDFRLMEELDGDAVRISYNGKKAERDIVQFVAYRSEASWMAGTGEATLVDDDMQQDDSEGIATAVTTTEEKPKRKSTLAEEVLAEIPAQLCGYMKVNGILPNMLTKADTESSGFGPVLPLREEANNKWGELLWDKIEWRLENINKRTKKIEKYKFLASCCKVTEKEDQIYLFKIQLNDLDEFWHARVQGEQTAGGLYYEVQELQGPFTTRSQPLVDFGNFD